jgi:hypothetical protein
MFTSAVERDAPRKPLILKGALQVGKTWALGEFGRRHYRDAGRGVHYFDFQRQHGNCMRSRTGQPESLSSVNSRRTSAATNGCAGPSTGSCRRPGTSCTSGRGSVQLGRRHLGSGVSRSDGRCGDTGRGEVVTTNPAGTESAGIHAKIHPVPCRKSHRTELRPLRSAGNVAPVCAAAHEGCLTRVPTCFGF